MKSAVEKIGSFNKFGSVLGLERVSELLRRLGNPQKNLKIIHVAGTNGKGSVCRFIYEILRKAGYDTGIYSSPYLEVFNERIEFNGEYIPDEYLDKYADKVTKIAGEMCDEGLLSPTEFDVVTAIGLMYFAEMKADFVLLEVGLGGRGDSTNVIDKPEITIISSISLDHTDRLGDTIEKIASEKAGIVKEGVAVVSGAEQQEAKNVIMDKADEKHARFIDASLFKPVIKEESVYGSTFDCCILGHQYRDMHISMAGRHQVDNAIVALTAVEVLSENDIISLDEAVIYEGMRSARNKGRFEPVGKNPVYILDGAHNEAGMKSFVKTVKEDIGPDKKLLTVVGILADKDIDKMMVYLGTLDSEFIATEPDNPRRLPMDKMGVVLKDAGRNVILEASPEDALQYVRENDRKYDAVLFVGSLYLIGKIRRLLHDGNKEAESSFIL